jgi:MoxR-like ATPase
MTTATSTNKRVDLAAVEAKILEKKKRIDQATDEIHRVVVGQHRMINRLLIGLFTGGHVLLEGVPGLAKTLTISTISKTLNLAFKRIQFTPDLLPADVIGTLIYNQREAKFEVKKGPIFANIILADEINRSPAKVQSALLEAMQEKQVTIGDSTFKLDRPFLVLATQNPVEQEGTYPLPEAQVDRFMMRVFVNYPSRDEEVEIMRRMAHSDLQNAVQPILSADEIFQIRDLIEQVELNERLENYIVDLIMATRDPEKFGAKDLKTFIEFGASPRATIAMNMAARALAMLNGRAYVLPDDIKAVAPDVLNHRIILSYEAQAEEVSTLDCVDTLLKTLPI